MLTNNNTCLSLTIMRSGKKGIGAVSYSQVSSDFLPQDQMDMSMCGNAMVNNMHNVMLFRGPISLMVPL